MTCEVVGRKFFYRELHLYREMHEQSLEPASESWSRLDESPLLAEHQLVRPGDRRTLPQGQVRGPVRGHSSQGPAWQATAHLWRPHPRGRPHTRPQRRRGRAHATAAFSAPHSHLRRPLRPQGGQGPARAPPPLHGAGAGRTR